MPCQRSILRWLIIEFCRMDPEIPVRIREDDISAMEPDIPTGKIPDTCMGTGCLSEFENVACAYVSGATEDHVISSLKAFVDGNPPARHASHFLKLVGVPAFDVSNVPRSVRHPNIIPASAGLASLVYPNSLCTLQDILHYSPDVIRLDWNIRFLVYQIVSALLYLHKLGIVHGDICPSNIMLMGSYWSWLKIHDNQLLGQSIFLKDPTMSLTKTCHYMENCPCLPLHTDLSLSTPVDWQHYFKSWWTGELSNYDYLVALNRLAGRRCNDNSFHTVMPWVIDFSVRPDENSDAGWRDLKKSKWRLAKGDEQLDFTYSTSDVPHHVLDECLSEIAVCSYKARRLPLSVLCSAVRPVYKPNEYPSNMQRLYQWTPDECIPEFYNDPHIFSSLHPDMSDLAIPSWAASPEEFISLHRSALESSRVSKEIHNWIDITFGYKLSGQAAITAKNVMLPEGDPLMPKSTGRRQLFTQPHPRRHIFVQQTNIDITRRGNVPMKHGVNSDLSTSSDEKFLPTTQNLQELEEAASFYGHARHLCPIYNHKDIIASCISCNDLKSTEEFEKEHSLALPVDNISSDINLQCLLECLEADDNRAVGYQELLRWKENFSPKFSLKDFSQDIFSVGCIIAELYLRKPLFDPISFMAHLETGVKPGLLSKLPPHVELVVGACIERDCKRRPSAQCLLESPFFPSSVRSAYLFLAPLNLLAKARNILQYTADFVNAGALRAMGPFTVEKCASYCVPFIIEHISDDVCESVISLLKNFARYLKPEGIKSLILPAIQKILQAPTLSGLKISLLQESFVQEWWKRVGKQVYLWKMHPLVILNLCNSPEKSSASAASVLLVSLTEELGVPIMVNQTILPLICCFGKGLCGDGIDALVRIGGLLGETFMIRHLLPLLKSFILSCLHISSTNKPEPLQSWSSLALIDCFAALSGLILIMPRDMVVKEVVLDQICIHIRVMMQIHVELHVIQVVLKGFTMICELIGPDLTMLHVLPQMKDLFNELAMSKDATEKKHSCMTSSINNLGSRKDVVCLLYPFFASLIGIERLRQGCPSWLLLEYHLQHFHDWKWEFVGDSYSDSGSTCMENDKFDVLTRGSDCSKLFLDCIGRSLPQSYAHKGGNFLRNYKKANFRKSKSDQDKQNSSACNLDPWFWFPNDVATWNAPDFLSRTGGSRDEILWKVKASVLYSIRAHPGSLKCLAVSNDERVVFSGGVGPGFKGAVKKWELSAVNCVSGYYGHEEIVNDICLLSVSGRVASCDGTIHIWNGKTSKLIAVYAEPSFSRHGSISSNTFRFCNDQANLLASAVFTEGIISTAFTGNLYTCMHFLESDELLVAGTGNGSIRFIDVAANRELHLWKSDTSDFSLSSSVSAICSWNLKNQETGLVGHQSLIAFGLSSGHCRLLDRRSGEVISSWQAHDSYVTKLSGPEDHLLVSSSLDKTLRVWDLRRNLSSQSVVFRGHSDGIRSFDVWGKDVISLSKNSIGITSLSRSDEGGMFEISPTKLYAEHGMRNLSFLTSISILPFSRLFIVGTEDGYLKICC